MKVTIKINPALVEKWIKSMNRVAGFKKSFKTAIKTIEDNQIIYTYEHIRR